jgi:hypothetical protein
MSEEFIPGDILIFQIESGYGLMKVIGVDDGAESMVWHVKAFRDLFIDIDTADAAAAIPQALTVEIPHVAMTGRAFESTQVALLAKDVLTPEEVASIENWRSAVDQEPSDRSIRLLMGLR